MPPLKKFLILLLGGVFLMLGVVGLLVPVLPGVLFLVLGLLCFAETSETVRTKLAAWYRAHRLRRHTRPSEGLSPLEKIELAGWKAAARVLGLSDRKNLR